MRVVKAMMLLVCLVAGPALAATADWRTPLYDGFEGTDFAPAGGLYYKKNFEQSAGRVDFQDKVVFDGRQSLKLSVHPICPASRKGCSERAEIWEKPELRAPYDQPVWYGFAVKFGAGIPQDDHRYLIAQWKPEIGPTAKGDFSPFIALRLDRGRLFATVETNNRPATSRAAKGRQAQCPAGQARVWIRPEENQMRALVATDAGWRPKDGPEFDACTDALKVVTHAPLPRPDSGWIRFAVLSRPGPKGRGHVEIFANGRWIVSVTGAVGQDDRGLGPHQYFKFGPYRAATTGDWTMYYDDFRRSPDCMDVLRDAAACAQVAAGG